MFMESVYDRLHKNAGTLENCGIMEIDSVKRINLEQSD